jgi:PAS domain S-box-containing protein
VTYRLDKALKERLPAQVEDLDRIWNVLQDLLVITDANGQYISVNPAWTTVLGWSEAELLGRMLLSCRLQRMSAQSVIEQRLRLAPVVAGKAP